MFSKNILRSLLSVLFLLICTTASVYSQSSDVEYNSSAMKGIDFTQYQSYAWLPFIDSINTNDYNKQVVDEQITAAANTELQGRGLKMDDTAPQLYIVYAIMLDREKGYVSEPVYGRPNVGVGVGFGRGGFGGMSVGVSSPSVVGHETKEVIYKKGALVFEVIDVKTKQTVWRGMASRQKEDKGELVNTKMMVDEIVPKIFKKFPVKAGKKK